MKISTLIFRSMRKNIRHYFLYFFSLIFSTTLYFSFLTISTNDDIVHLQQADMKAGAAFNAGAIILLIIVILFVFYANQLFMKRRSKEIGLYQMIGMPKSTINGMLVIENIILWISAICIGVLCGFFFSRLFTLIFLKVINNDKIVSMYFSQEALGKTLLVFAIILIIVLLQTVWMVSRSKLLDLFQASSKAEQRVKKISTVKILLGIVGLVLIVFGYYRSTILFDLNESVTMTDLTISMGIILLSVILGTFLVFHYSISFIMNTIRASRKGHLTISDVLAVSPIMHRMRASSISLSLITILTALALGVLSLGYIAYYGVTASSDQYSPYDYTTFNKQSSFEQALNDAEIDYRKTELHILNVQANTNTLMVDPPDYSNFEMDYSTMFVKLSEAQQTFPSLKLKDDEAAISGYSNMLETLLNMQTARKFEVDINGLKKQLTLTTIEKQSILPNTLTYGNPAFIISDKLYDELSKQPHIKKQTLWNSLQGYDVDKKDLKQTEDLYVKTTHDGQFKVNKAIISTDSKETSMRASVERIGLVIFISGFIGLAFLLATGSILYFKQMSEADDERHSFIIMRKIGFTSQDIMRGIYVKQLLSFGLPLIIGILHSYFAVKCGWMFFGSELYAPLFITMGIYIILYSLFAILTTHYYKKIVTTAL